MASSRKTSQPNEVAQLVAQIPPVTRSVLLAFIVLYTFMRAEIVSYEWLCFQPYDAFMKMQIWRVFTGPLIIFKGKMGTLFTLFEFYTHSSHLETYHFSGKENAEYVYLVCVLLAGVVSAVTVLQIQCPFTLVEGFMASLTCLWSIKNWNTPLMFYGLFPIKGKYNPLLQLFLSYLFDDEQQTLPVIVIGLVVGYVYNCLDTKSLGPLYGYVRGSAQGYGLVNDGHFRAPRWLTGIWGFLVNNRRRTVNVIVKNTHSYQGQGRKLGNKQEPINTAEREATKTREERAAAAAAARAKSAPTENAKNLNFRGTGQRVGSN
ncbi:LAFA_0D03136g1_1 [Lachancea sp. 'fantastica']|nr:LAFA_0D03136g1_1 [Lachancea sp. 'fantastica']